QRGSRFSARTMEVTPSNSVRTVKPATAAANHRKVRRRENAGRSIQIAFHQIGGCEFRPFCNPLYYMSQLDFLMSAAHAYHQATSDGQYDRKSSDDADSRSTLRARVHRIYLSAPVDAPAGAEV